MVASSQLTQGMILSLDGQLYKVESTVKVAVPKANPFIKTKLRDMKTGKIVEKNFKLDQEVTEASMQKRKLEFLYIENKQYVFLDVSTLDQVVASSDIIGGKVNYLKEGTEVTASFYGTTVFGIQLPQFMEIMVVGIDTESPKAIECGGKIAQLETGATVPVPFFVEIGDVLRIDTETEGYVQRV